jgi:Tol biopolymer transport system component
MGKYFLFLFLVFSLTHTDSQLGNGGHTVLSTLNWKFVGQPAETQTPVAQNITSHIKILDIETGAIETVLTINEHFEAPNWHPDNYLILNSKGKIYTLDLASKKLAELNTGYATACNNDHGISPDKKWLVSRSAEIIRCKAICQIAGW